MAGDLDDFLIPGRKPLAKAVGVTGFDLDLIPAALNLKIFNSRGFKIGLAAAPISILKFPWIFVPSSNLPLFIFLMKTSKR